MIKVFLSQPFHDRTEDSIFFERSKILRMLESLLEDEVEIMDQYHHEIPEGASRGWHMVNDLTLLLKADKVIFAPGWSESSGCRLEMDFCKKYGIKYTMWHNV